jgi:hypothetical protein
MVVNKARNIEKPFQKLTKINISMALMRETLFRR